MGIFYTFPKLKEVNTMSEETLFTFENPEERKAYWPNSSQDKEPSILRASSPTCAPAPIWTTPAGSSTTASS